MQTSYYFKSANHPNAVSVAAKSPRSYSGRKYKKLAPEYWFFKRYKEDGDKEFYTEQYNKEVLSVLDPNIVYAELGENAVLLCWESSEKFCHRHLIAKWLMENLGIKIKEII